MPTSDPARALLDNKQWQDALNQLLPRVAQGEAAALLLLAELPETAAVPLQLRLAAADILGAHDPRRLAPHTGENWLGTYWCPIASGSFWYGDDRVVANDTDANTTAVVDAEDAKAVGAGNTTIVNPDLLKQVDLSYAFQIGRYPVTNAEFARFIAADGYQKPHWWTEQGWQQREECKWIAPRSWETPQYNRPNQPVVGISWYEAVAYCAWLTEVGHTAAWLPHTAEIRLPTSLEWERAARHTDRRPYPWGSTRPTPAHTNYHETGIGRPTPVGCFPAGGAVCGAQDMVGNVQEWMATPADQREEVQAAKDIPLFSDVLASWSMYHDDEAGEFLCGIRGWYFAVNRIFSKGFRVIWSPRPDHRQ
jgi:formylglycine-generating enzyme required for sulfatase activity